VTFQILLYHGLYRDRQELSGKPTLEYVSEAEFSQHVLCLVENGYRLLSLTTCRDRVELGTLPEKTVCLTFDDGKQSDLHLAAPILHAAGAQATFFVIPGWLGNRNVMAASDIRELAGLGMEIGSHSMSHPFLTELGSEALRGEVEGSKSFLEDLLGRRVQSFAYPYGDLDAPVRAAVEKAGYRVGCGTRRGLNTPGKDWLSLRRWGIRENVGSGRLSRILKRKSPSFGESTAEVIKRAMGMRRYVRWRDRWLGYRGD